MSETAARSPLAIRRFFSGLTQTEAARRAGLSRQHFSLIESGRWTPRKATAIAIAHTLNCDVSELFPEYADLTTSDGRASLTD